MQMFIYHFDPDSAHRDEAAGPDVCLHVGIEQRVVLLHPVELLSLWYSITNTAYVFMYIDSTVIGARELVNTEVA